MGRATIAVQPDASAASPRVGETLGSLEVAGARLQTRAVLPAAGMTPWARIVLLHGYGEHAGRHAHALRWLAERGIACRTFDFRGQGNSSGRHGYIRRWEDYLDDAQAVLADEAAHAPAGVPRFLMGHSHGGLVAALGVIRGVLHADACILSAPYFRNLVPISRRKLVLGHLAARLIPWYPFPSGMPAEWMSSDPEMIADSNADPLVRRLVTPRWYFSMQVAQAEALRKAGSFRLPLLCLTGDADPVADPQATESFYAKAGSTDKTLLRYPDLKHELLREAARETVLQNIYDWVVARAEKNRPASLTS